MLLRVRKGAMPLLPYESIQTMGNSKDLSVPMIDFQAALDVVCCNMKNIDRQAIAVDIASELGEVRGGQLNRPT
jgi:hypothetical protein